jgi:hypothetical protein
MGRCVPAFAAVLWRLRGSTIGLAIMARKKRNKRNAERGKAAGDKPATPEQAELAETARKCFFEPLARLDQQRAKVVVSRVPDSLADAIAARLPATVPLPNPPAVPVRLKSGKEWVPEVVKPERDKLLAIGTTKASCWVASRTPPDGKQVQPRSIEKILRDHLGFPKAFRGSKQRPK